MLITILNEALSLTSYGGAPYSEAGRYHHDVLCAWLCTSGSVVTLNTVRFFHSLAIIIIIIAASASAPNLVHASKLSSLL